MDLKTLVSGRDRSGWDFLGIVSGCLGVTKYYFLLFILRLSSTMMCSLAHLICLDRSPESLNEYTHCGHLVFLLCIHLMCLVISPESLNEYKYCKHLFFLTLLCTHSMCTVLTDLQRHSRNTNIGHLVFLTLLCTRLMCLDRSTESFN
jgi:hypothetical protein